MESNNEQAVTLLLSRIRDGDRAATSELLNVAYSELRSIAGHILYGQSAGNTLQPTALVNEVCAKMLRSPETDWNDRNHFFRAAARAMRNLLTDHARAKKAQRRGGGAVRICLDTADLPAASSGIDLLVLDETLTRLSAMDERLGQVFELRFLVGLSVERTAEIVGTSARTVQLDTHLIRAWLQKELTP